MNAIMQILTAQSLSSPGIGFELTSNQKAVFKMPSGQTLKDRIIQIFGSSFNNAFIEIKHSGPPIAVYGYISKPEFSRKDRGSEYFFIDKRPITHKTLHYSLEQAYSGLLMSKRFPISIIFIDAGEGNVDINVHPTKAEVRFRDDRLITSIIYHTAFDELRKACLIPQMQISQQGITGKPQDDFDKIVSSKSEDNQTLQGQKESIYPSSSAADIFRSPEQYIRSQFKSDIQKGAPGDLLDSSNKTGPEDDSQEAGPSKLLFSLIHSHANPEQLPSDFSGPSIPVDSPDKILSSLWTNQNIPLEPIGQIAATYIVASFDTNLLLVDQHAAHERLLYIYLKNISAQKAEYIQSLLIPFTFDVKITDMPVLISIQSFLKELGVDIQPFGGTTFIVNSIPISMTTPDIGKFINDILDDLHDQKIKTEGESFKDRIITRMACRAAIKSGQSLSIEEIRELLKNLRNTPLSFTCPHGRPTMILITKNQLDKQFKRIVT